MYASAGQIGAPGLGGRNKRATGPTAPEPDCSGLKKSPAGVQEGVLTAGQGSGALALGGRLSAPDNPTRQIVSVKQNGRRVAPRAVTPSPGAG